MNLKKGLSELNYFILVRDVQDSKENEKRYVQKKKRKHIQPTQLCELCFPSYIYYLASYLYSFYL